MRFFGSWLALACAACAAPAPAPAPPVPPRPVYTPLAIAPPPPLATHPVQRLCATARAISPAPQTAKPRAYDFTPIAVTLRGPTLETEPLDGARRDAEAIRGAVIALRPTFAHCVATARAKGFRGEPSLIAGYFAALKLRFTVDPFGAASEIVVEGPPQLACVRDVLAQLAVTRPTPRTTRVAMRLELRHLEQTTGARPVPAPARTGCMFARDPLPVDEIAVGTVAFDFLRPHRPRRNCGHRTADKAQIRAAVTGNLGALRACYAAAHARQPGLAGIVDTKFVLDAWSTPSQITVGGAGDPALHTCITSVLEATIVGSRPEVPLVVTLPLELDPVADDASAIAARAYADASRARDAAAECTARIAAIDAFAKLPRGPDARTAAAIAALDRFLDAHGRPAACIEQARATLVAIAIWPARHQDGSQLRFWRGAGLAEAVDRTHDLLRELPELRAELLPFAIDANLARFRTNAALADALTYFGLPSTTPQGRKRVAEAYAVGVDQRDGVLPFDDCESNAPY